MAVQFEHFKRYKNFYGVDFKSNDLEYPEEFATDLLNVQMRKNGTIEKRKGYQGHGASSGGIGLFAYQRNNPVTGVQDAIVLSIDEELRKLETSTLTISYSGAEASAFVNIIYDADADVYSLNLTAGTQATWTQSLGVAVDSPTIFTLANLVTAINAHGMGFTASVTGDSSVPAPFLSAVVSYDIVSSGSLTVDAKYWSLVPCPVSTPFASTWAKRNESHFENVSSTQLQNCIYFSSGYNDVMKYDGQKLYRAGVPTPELNAFTFTGSGSEYIYALQFIQGDAVLNDTAGNLAYTDPIDKAAFPSSCTASVKNLLPASGFNATGAIISLAAGPTRTLTVTVGHTIIAGDKIYFWDDTTGVKAFVTRTVVSKTPTTITFDSSEDEVTVLTTGTDNKNVISNNLRIAIYRNTAGAGLAGLFYEVIQIPNNPFATDSTWVDSVIDGDLEIKPELIVPLTDRSPPVSGKYVTSFQNLMVTAGNITDPNVVSFSDIESPEYFPIPDNQITVTNLIGDKITAIAPSNENFIIFQNSSIHAVTGDVPDQNFRVDLITSDIGCVSHASIQDVRGALFFLSQIGPRFIQGAQIPQAIGADKENGLVSRIDPLFEQRGLPDSEKYQLKRAISFNDKIGEKYWLFLPVEQTIAGEVSDTSDSRVIVYDYSRGAWLVWNNKDFGSGIISVGDEIYWQEKRWAQTLSEVKHYLYRQYTLEDSQSYQDDGAPIISYYKSPWEFMGEAGVLKSFKAIRVYGVEDLDKPFQIDITTERDWIRDAPLSECSLTFGVGGYGNAEYNTGPYGDPSTTALKHPLANGRVYALRVILANSEHQTSFSLTGYELEIAANYKPEFKS